MWNPFRRERPEEKHFGELIQPSISSIPLQQPAGLPELNVIKYTTENPHIKQEVLSEFFGFSPQQITFSDFTDEDIRYLMDELEIYETIQEDCKLKFNVFRKDFDEKRSRFGQFKNVIWVSALKGKGGQQRDKAYSSTSVNDTRIQTGASLPLKKERSGLARIFLG